MIYGEFNAHKSLITIYDVTIQFLIGRTSTQIVFTNIKKHIWKISQYIKMSGKISVFFPIDCTHLYRLINVEKPSYILIPSFLNRLKNHQNYSQVQTLK